MPNVIPEIQLERLIRGELSANEEAELLALLENDEARQQLENFVADEDFRADVAEVFSHRLGDREEFRPLIERLRQKVARPAESEPVTLDFLDPPANTGHIGVFDGYGIIECVGCGGMGIVFKALDNTLNRIVAVKVLAPQMATENARKRFLREARAAAAVSHDHVVGIHAVGEWRDLPYLVMEFIAGVSLQERINTGVPLELAEVLRIGLQTAEGLAAAHAQGVIHRDVKPGNIMLENGVQRVKLTDFGLARSVTDTEITREGMVTGTPEYMAPEQAECGEVDHRADLFSLGSVLYATATGISPFRASTPLACIRRVCDDQPTEPQKLNSQLPAWFGELVGKLQEKRPEDRYQSAKEVTEILGERLTELQEGGKTGDDERASSGPYMGIAAWVLISTAMLSFAGLAVVLLALAGDDKPTRAVASHKNAESTVPDAPPPTKPDPRLAANISLSPPFKPPYEGAPADRLSLQYAVMEVCNQIGLSYQFDRSQTNIAPLNRRWVTPGIADKPADEALQELLTPLGLTYAVDGSDLYLTRLPSKSN